LRALVESRHDPLQIGIYQLRFGEPRAPSCLLGSGAHAIFATVFSKALMKMVELRPH
jgi:hypothetical protein